MNNENEIPYELRIENDTLITDINNDAMESASSKLFITDKIDGKVYYITVVGNVLAMGEPEDHEIPLDVVNEYELKDQDGYLYKLTVENGWLTTIRVGDVIIPPEEDEEEDEFDDDEFLRLLSDIVSSTKIYQTDSTIKVQIGGVDGFDINEVHVDIMGDDDINDIIDGLD